jgi:hypothetical protein
MNFSMTMNYTWPKIKWGWLKVEVSIRLYYIFYTQTSIKKLVDNFILKVTIVDLSFRTGPPTKLFDLTPQVFFGCVSRR